MQEVTKNRFASVGKIDIAQITQDPLTGENTITFISNPLYQAVRCQIEDHDNRTEVRRPDMTIAIYTVDIMLDRCIVELTVSSRITIDNMVYDILNISNDDSKSHTELVAEIINNNV